jgi:DNA polymerase III subunit delta
MTFDQIISDIRNKVYYPVYLLMGEEPYFIDTISDLIEDTVLEEQYQEFNKIVVYGRDVDARTIINQAKSYPMSGNYQVLIVKEAQDVKDIDVIEPYVLKPLESTILVLNYKYKKIDRRKSLARTVEKKGVLFESKKLYENSIPDWIVRYLAQKNFNITPKACQMIADYLGNDLQKVRNELEKLIISQPPGTKISEDAVERNIGISKDFNVFELQNALGKKDIRSAYRIAIHFGANSKENPLLMTVVILYNYYVKLLKCHYTTDKTRNNLASVLGVNPFFVNDYIEAIKNYPIAKIVQNISVLREYDLKAKGMGTVSPDDSELYKELIYKLLH